MSKTNSIDNDNVDITYVGTWGGGGDDPTYLAEADASGASASWSIASGNLFAGINFRKDDEAGIANVSVYNDTKSEYVLNGELVDLYTADKDATNNEYEDYVMWIKLPYEDDLYTVTVIHNSTYNGSSASPYNITIEKYFTTESLSDADVVFTATLTHSDHEGYSEDFVLEDSGDFIKRLTQTTDEIDTTFYCNGDNRGTDLYRVGYRTDAEIASDADITWYEPYAVEFSWGSDGIDEEVDDDGYFYIIWDTAPEAGETYIEYYVKYDQVQLTYQLQHPDDGSDYIDYHSNLRITDFGLELV